MKRWRAGAGEGRQTDIEEIMPTLASADRGTGAARR